jgi:hypothetical protein
VTNGCEFKIGELVEYRAWYDGDGAWISIENQVGIVLEIIAITDATLNRVIDDIIIYEIKVYWITEGKVEFVPDLFLVEYGDEILEFL